MSAKIFIEEIASHCAYDGELIGLFAEGNHSDEEFLTAAREHLELYSDTINFVGQVIHDRIRRIPRSEEEYEIKYNARGKGSEEVTRIKVAFQPLIQTRVGDQTLEQKGE